MSRQYQVKCDDDGTIADSVEPPFATTPIPPQGWAHVSVVFTNTDGQIVTQELDLCPKCIPTLITGFVDPPQTPPPPPVATTSTPTTTTTTGTTP